MIVDYLWAKSMGTRKYLSTLSTKHHKSTITGSLVLAILRGVKAHALDLIERTGRAETRVFQ